MTVSPDEVRLEHWVRWTLLIGVVISGVLLLAGLMIMLATGNQTGAGLALLNTGLLTLIATPVVRVAVLGVGWLILGPRWLAAIALTVLALLGLGVFLGAT
jgi:uncharacterized membrane protein